MAGKSILNYTTSVPADKTAFECCAMLMKFGAKNVALSLNDDKTPDGLDFVITLPWGDARQYALPVNIGGTQKVLLEAHNARRIERRFTAPDQAARVAWRIMKDWLDVQLALIEAGGVVLEQVMLPYMRVSPDQTLYGHWKAEAMKELES